MEYNVEERKFIKRRYLEGLGILIPIAVLAIAAYSKYKKDGKDDEEYRTYVPMIGAIVSAFLTQYSVFTNILFSRTMKKY